MNDQSVNESQSVFAAPWPRWLRFGQACTYVGIRSATMTLKLAAGIGPAYRFVPGSRVKIFHTSELDRWIEETPPPPMSDAERGRLEKLQAGARRVREAWRQAKINKKTDA
jgi:hypothetical protein